ncbi:MAG: phosphoribosylformylglycinamidine synthase subunit PurQ [Nitrospinae bacterium]|nr:phosphoribosylformylglycinamidine synthase subunit PurQ [Nitrospinota bacterium]
MKFAVIVFPGSNCDHDCYHALKHDLGVDVEFVWHTERSLDGYDMVTLPGGFSYGDYLRAGAIARFSPVMGAVERFAKRGGPVLGICNGFQILTEAGLLPGALAHNEHMKFICKDVHARVETSNSFATGGIEKGKVLRIPVAHMEGRYTAPDETLKKLLDEDRVLLRYCEKDGRVTGEANPNGSAMNIAGVLSEKRNVAGMMPHPERVCESALGGTDGLAVFESIISSLSAV